MAKFFLLVFCFFVSSYCIGQEYKIEGNELVFDQPISFKSGTAELSPDDLKTLESLFTFLEEKKYISLLRIEGHVSSNSNNAQGLSEKRAIAIAKWLVAKGIDCKRLICVGFGNNKPIVAATSAENNRKNTRINFVMAALKDKLIGGMPADGGGKIAGDPCQIAK